MPLTHIFNGRLQKTDTLNTFLINIWFELESDTHQVLTALQADMLHSDPKVLLVTFST